MEDEFPVLFDDVPINFHKELEKAINFLGKGRVSDSDLLGAFIWGNTPQGVGYWYEINKQKHRRR